jgi:hypothetical protein
VEPPVGTAITITLPNKCARWPELPHLAHLRESLSHGHIYFSKEDGKEGTDFRRLLLSQNKQRKPFVCARVTLIPDLIVDNSFCSKEDRDKGFHPNVSNGVQRQGLECRDDQGLEIGRWTIGEGATTHTAYSRL